MIFKKRFIIILSIILISAICIIPRVYADETTTSADTSETYEDLGHSDELTNTSVPAAYKTSTINNISALPQANLNLNNILSFILIGIGIVNIILGIAVLISSKRN